MKSKEYIQDFNIWYVEQRGQHAVTWEHKKLEIFNQLEADILNLISLRKASSFSGVKSIHEEVHEKYKIISEAVNKRFGFKILKSLDFINFMSTRTGLLYMKSDNYIHVFSSKIKGKN